MPVVSGSWSPTPATRQRSTLVAEVLRYVMLPNDTDAQSVAADAINDAIRKYNLQHWHSSLTYQDISLSADTANYDLSAPFKSPRHAELLNSSGEPERYLNWYDSKTFGLAFPRATASGTPVAYTCYNSESDGKLTLSVPPTSDFVTSYPTLRLRYYAKIAYLSNSSDTFDGPSEVESFLCWHARMYLASIYDQSKVPFAKSQADEFWGMCIRSDAENQETDWGE